MENKNRLKEDTITPSNGGEEKTVVNIKKTDLGDSAVTTNLKKLGDNVNVNVVDEDVDVLSNQETKEVIKYLSNIKDSESGEISQPFTIDGKTYQMVRAKKGKETINGVYSHDLNETGENVIHSVEDFEANIANPMREIDVQPSVDIQDTPQQVEAGLMEYLNLNDLAGFKHFFVDIDSGNVSGKFKTTREMMDSGQKLGEKEVYMERATLKKFRMSDFFKSDMTENVEGGVIDNEKLKSDVKKLTNLIKDKFSVALSKLDKPAEQVQFLQAMASEIGVPLNKISTLMSSFKAIGQQQVAESRKLTKNQLIESINKNKVK